MPIDKKELRRYIEELNLSEPLTANLLQELEADEKRAVQFVGQRLRQDDFTRKTQELADQRKTLESAVSGQVKEYAQKLQEADQKVANILKDLEGERINRATAEMKLKRVAEQYEIHDDDLKSIIASNEPPISRNAPPAGITEEKLAEILAKRETELVNKLMPELMSFPQISAIQQEIRDNHFELTGKRLTAAEMTELMKEAPKAGGLIKAWEEKHGIAGIRQERHDKEVTAKAIEAYKTEEMRKASEAAIATVHNQDGVRPLSTSPVLREYRNRAEEPAAANGGNGNGKGNEPPQPRMSGAERAATKWVERRNQGIGLGKEAPAAKAS